MCENQRKRVKAVNSPQDNKERKDSCPFVDGKLLHRFPEIHYWDKASDSALFLISNQLSGPCSYKIVLAEKGCSSIYRKKLCASNLDMTLLVETLRW